MQRGALIVGIDDYPEPNRLYGCVNDAQAVTELLRTHGDGSLNFNVVPLINVRSKTALLNRVTTLFNAELHTALFYFAGHGSVTPGDGKLITPDFHTSNGISMKELLAIINQSRIMDKIIIIDCCDAGAFGLTYPASGIMAQLSEGTTIITSARPHEQAIEKNGHGIFTGLLIEALKGGAAEISGSINTGGVYQYIDSILNFLDQRPQFRANVNYFISLRQIPPAVPFDVLRKITTYFLSLDYQFPLNPAYEDSCEYADPTCTPVFKHLKKYQSVGLVVPEGEEFMYNAAMNSKACKLTALGQQYWKLVKQGKV